jgi:DNA helicase-2/ATP-dependent DNA helicase PcrA
MTEALDTILKELTAIQQAAVSWGEGAVLVLAGPGSGKTRVLTARIARLLNETRTKNFRILALTFTTKAAMEMRERVETLVPGLTERTFIGTFHAFCTQVLRQHGSHLGIRPDFGIYDQDNDREALLADALREAKERGEDVVEDDTRWLKTIDQLKARLVLPEKAAAQFRDPPTGARVARVYQVYEAALRSRNVLDFNGLILDCCRLFRDVPEVAARLRRSYPYWLIDEFQDTSPAQYKLIRLLAGDDFRNVFIVADDDQIIYQWAGASYRQIELFRESFQPELIQLVQNHRCPPVIVEAANRLVAHNTRRTPNKQPLIAVRQGNNQPIILRTFKTDAEERDTLAAEIAARDPKDWGQIAILGRTRSLLVPMLDSLKSKGVRAVLAQRRDRFISPQFVWLQECLDQALRPSDRQVFTIMVDAANRISDLSLDAATLIAEAEAAGQSYFEHWGLVAASSESDIGKQLGRFSQQLAQSRTAWRNVVRDAIPILLKSAGSTEGVISDADDDRAAWDACVREIRAEKGGEPELAELIQGLALRSKEPPPDPTAVSVLTVHASKGLEFDAVYLIGLAESVMPSWQSIQKGVASAEMEEERRNCFVAITRTREQLVLSRAETYRDWRKEPSRFLREMGLIDSETTP